MPKAIDTPMIDKDASFGKTFQIHSNKSICILKS